LAAASATAQLTLPDGRLHVGTHLPLLAQRYRYLSLLGEGVSAQVGAAARGWV
jgi:homeodomain interacting protein kinase